MSTPISFWFNFVILVFIVLDCIKQLNVFNSIAFVVSALYIMLIIWVAMKEDNERLFKE